MEMARESQRFYDSEKQQFFKGEPDKCSIKLGGALDGVFGYKNTDGFPSVFLFMLTRVRAQSPI